MSQSTSDDMRKQVKPGSSKYIQDGDPEEKFELLGSLGEGSYGAVWEAQERSTKEHVAIKIIPVDDDIKELEKEIAILQKCKSEYVVSFKGAWFKDQNMWIVMEFCLAGSVNDLMHVRRSPFDEAMIRLIIAAALLGLDYLHSNNMIHRDVKAGNVLITKSGQAKLADFGVSAQLSETTLKRKTVIGTPFWMAPEVIQEVSYDSKADLWSLGITVIELAQMDPPHSNIHPMRAIFMIPSRPPPTLDDPEKWSSHMIDFLEKCLKKNPEERPTTKELMKHPFVEKRVNELRNANPPGSSPRLKELGDKCLEALQKYREQETSRALEATHRSYDPQNTAVFLEEDDESAHSGTAESTGTMVRDPGVTSKRPGSAAHGAGRGADDGKASGGTLKLEDSETAEPGFMAYFRTKKKDKQQVAVEQQKRISKKLSQRVAAAPKKGDQSQEHEQQQKQQHQEESVPLDDIDMEPAEVERLKGRLGKLEKQFKLDLKDLKVQYEKRKAALLAAGQSS